SNLNSIGIMAIYGIFVNILIKRSTRTSWSSLKTFKLCLPPTDEQQKIAAILSTIQQAIELQDSLINTTQELKKALMQKLFTEGLRGETQKETEIGLVPKSWDVFELKDISEKPKYGLTTSAKETGEYKFLRITDITDLGVDWDSVPFCDCSNAEYEKYKLEENDIVFARIGATTGKSFIIKSPSKSVFASYLIKVKAKSINPDFLYIYFQTNQYWKQINTNKGNNLKGGVNGSILSQLKVTIPNESEQKDISNLFCTLDKKINFSQTKKKLLTELFNTMLHKLMTAEIRVNELDLAELEQQLTS
ncbi:MAG: restriction endonuclease subunit S, partial [Gammaproteobacteria bacterium]